MEKVDRFVNFREYKSEDLMINKMSKVRKGEISTRMTVTRIKKESDKCWQGCRDTGVLNTAGGHAGCVVILESTLALHNQIR